MKEMPEKREAREKREADEAKALAKKNADDTRKKKMADLSAADA
jgi:hypothetical protein